MRFTTHVHFSMALASIFNFFMPVSMMIDPKCDYYENLVLGRRYFIHNPEYPYNYAGPVACRWMARSDPGTRIVVSCEDITLPSSSGCKNDRLAISLSGDENFSDSRNYCGSGNITLVSNGNALSVGLFAPSSSGGGRFVCTVTSILETSSTTTQAPPNICDCGWQQKPRIVGGVETGVNEFPQMAGIVDSQSRTVYCGGTIISERYVLTAAHCMLGKTVNTIAILVGDHDISTGTDTASSALYAVLAYEMHPNFDSNTLENDIVLLKTVKTMSFSIRVGPACLPFRYSGESFTGQVVTALGWGTLEFSGPTSDTLQKVNLTVFPVDECAKEHDDPVTYDKICTYGEGKDACQYDSGGPLFWTDSSTTRLQLVGIISMGVGCATTRPGVNTRVTSYLSWIVSRTSDATYCIK